MFQSKEKSVRQKALQIFDPQDEALVSIWIQKRVWCKIFLLTYPGIIDTNGPNWSQHIPHGFVSKVSQI